MTVIPPTLTAMANSKKAVTFYLIAAMWVPSVRNAIGYDVASLNMVSYCFMAYVFAQGLKDLGLGIGRQKVTDLGEGEDA